MISTAYFGSTPSPDPEERLYAPEDYADACRLGLAEALAELLESVDFGGDTEAWDHAFGALEEMAALGNRLRELNPAAAAILDTEEGGAEKKKSVWLRAMGFRRNPSTDTWEAF